MQFVFIFSFLSLFPFLWIKWANLIDLKRDNYVLFVRMQRSCAKKIYYIIFYIYTYNSAINLFSLVFLQFFSHFVAFFLCVLNIKAKSRKNKSLFSIFFFLFVRCVIHLKYTMFTSAAKRFSKLTESCKGRKVGFNYKSENTRMECWLFLVFFIHPWFTLFLVCMSPKYTYDEISKLNK